MTNHMKHTLALGTLLATALSLPAWSDQPMHNGGSAAGLTLYSAPGQGGRSLHVTRDTSSLESQGFDNLAQSMKVTGGRWEVCDGSRYRDDCEVFGPGKYDLRSRGWSGKIGSVRPLSSGAPTVTLYWGKNYSGESHIYASQSRGMKYFGTNEKAMSAKVNGGLWMLCSDSYLAGRCVLVDKSIPDLGAWKLAHDIASVGKGKETYGYSSGQGQITLYDDPDQRGLHVSIGSDVFDLNAAGFNDRASSLRLSGGPWEVCDRASYQGHCEVVRHNMRDLARMGMNNRISSVRRYVPPADGSGDAWNDDDGNNHGGSGPGYNSWNHGSGEFGRGVGGQRTVFFPAPQLDGIPVAACLTPGFQCGKTAADKFCQAAGLSRSVYSDETSAYGEVRYLGRSHGMHGNSPSGKRKLVDVLCTR